ncbi:hypothetical protein C8R45DRAFT_1172882 [Mycena sanguinolenta]|nr:hypothetical protein C8R45DRAFT_1172882 [Mycena sanguinolenta]
MSDVPPTKRRRTDDDPDDVDAKEIVRSTEYWFDEGNIILQVESTQFRLPKSMLSMHSNVFRDMFMMPLPADEPTVEGCPVVILTGDTVEDWTHVLGAIFPKFLMETPSLALVAAILRLSKKYDFPEFRKDCLRRLRKEFPVTLEEFDECDDSWSYIKDEKNIYLSVLSLAHEIGLHSILPLLYCLMVAVDNDQYMPKILDLNDGSVSTSDRLACTLGVVNLLRLQSNTTMKWHSYIPCDPCKQDYKCGAAVKQILLDLAEVDFPELHIVDDWDEKWEKDLCRHCRKEAKKVFEAGRERCWKGLPAAFGLPDWEKLKSLDLE